MIDLTAVYPERIIEGIDRAEIIRALNGESDIFLVKGKNLLVHKATGKHIALSCVKKYFEPSKSYYHLDERSTCEFVQHAMQFHASNCVECFKKCIDTNHKIKPVKIRFSSDYFNK